MRSTILIVMLAIAAPALAAADDDGTPGTAVTSAASTQAPGGTQAPAPTATEAPKPPSPLDRRRRGSLVGYIADATIESQVRVRFDAGLHNNVPDRAEFFYGQCGCNFSGAPGPGGVGAGDLVTDLDFQQLTVDAQYAVNRRVAVFAALPFRFVEPQSFLGETLRPALPHSFQHESGLSDIRAGAKAALVSTAGTVLTAQAQWYFHSGDSRKGLGTNHASVEPVLLLHQRLSDRLTLESQVGDWHPIDGSKFGGTSYAGDVFFYGVGPSFELVSTDRVRFAPVLELVGWHVLGGQQQAAGKLGSAEGTNIVNLKVGARTSIGRYSFYVGYGRALTDAVWYSDIVRVEYRYSF
jgi:hypothetical protein